jgi:hypothetical protein
VHGTKLELFKSFKSDFLAAAEVKRTGAFYSRIAQMYLAKYGYNTPWDGDLEEGQTVADDVDPDEDVNNLSVEEATARAEYYKQVWGVGCHDCALLGLLADIPYQKIAMWYNTKYGSVEKKQPAVTFRQVFDKPELEPAQPVRMQILHYYSHHFYEEHIKPHFTRRWAAVCWLLNPPAPLALCNVVTREAWAAETEASQAEVVAAREPEHKRAMDAYSIVVLADVPSTAEEYNV